MGITMLGRNSSAAAAALGPRERFGRRSRKAKPSWVGWCFIGPFLLVFLLTLVAPVLYAIYLSLYQTKLIGGTSFVGLANYVAAFHDPQFHTALWHVVLLFLVQVPIMLAVSTAAALALDSARLHFVVLCIDAGRGDGLNACQGSRDKAVQLNSGVKVADKTAIDAE